MKTELNHPAEPSPLFPTVRFNSLPLEYGQSVACGLLGREVLKRHELNILSPHGAQLFFLCMENTSCSTETFPRHIRNVWKSVCVSSNHNVWSERKTSHSTALLASVSLYKVKSWVSNCAVWYKQNKASGLLNIRNTYFTTDLNYQSTRYPLFYCQMLNGR